jgi:hypothetical protein
MIQANELRTGNWLLLDTGVALPFPHRIMPKDIYDLAEGKITISALQPLPLTPKLLEKCGFVIYGSDNVHTVYGNNQDDSDFFLDYDWRHRENGFNPMIKSREYETIGSSIKYLHQLQNLYFALTETELKINL